MRRAISRPPHESEPGANGALILHELTMRLHSYVSLSASQAVAVALWVLHTHAFTAAGTTPYLSITSTEKRSGKTRLLEVLELVCACPWLTGRVTAAVLARKVDAVRPTLLLDESDAAFHSDKEYAQTLRGMLNSGHRRGGKASVCVRAGARIGFSDLDVFCPKAIAGIGELPDTVADRSIRIELKRKAPDEHIHRFRRREAEPSLTALRQLLAAWAHNHQEQLEEMWPELPEELDDRAADGWEPLLAIADLAGQDWPKLARAAALKLSTGSAREEKSIGIRLLADIRSDFDHRATDRTSTADLLSALAADAEAPWGDWNGRGPLTARNLGQLLKQYGISSRTLRLPDATTPKGFHRAQFEDAWRRYLPPHATKGAAAATTPQRSCCDGPDAGRNRHNAPQAAEREQHAIALQTTDVAAVADQIDRLGSGEIDADAEFDRIVAKFPEFQRRP